MVCAADVAKQPEPAPPAFSLLSGVYTNDLALELKAGAASIRYSIDGSEPNFDSPIYKEPLQITNCAMVRARAWYADGSVSRTVTENYWLLAEDLLGFSSNLPLLLVNSGAEEIVSAEKSLGSARVIVGKRSGQVTLLGEADFTGLAVLNVRGHSSLRYPKHSYALKVVNELKDARKVSILALPKESDWVVYGPYPDKTLMRDVLAYELSNKMGRWAPHARFVEVFVNETRGKLSMEQYMGLYVFEEKVTRDKSRVNIAKLDPSENQSPEISGGYLFKKDHASRFERKNFDADGPPQAAQTTNRIGYPSLPGGFPGNPAGFLPPYVAKVNTNKPPPKVTTARPKKPKPAFDPNRPTTNYVAATIPGTVKLADETVFHEDEGFKTTLQRNQFYFCEPEPDEITPVQRGWLKDYINEFESALYGPSFTNAVTGYSRFIDSQSFIDYHLLVEVTKNVDAFRFSTFYYKDRGGPLKMGPAWDWNLSFGNADGKQGWFAEYWLWPQLDDQQYTWFRRLFEDPDFAQRYADRWAELRANIFGTSNIVARVDELAKLLNEAQERNFAKWDIMGRHVNPNWFIGESYAAEVGWMKQWITNRLAWIDDQFPPAPSVGAAGKMIALATAIPDAKIYFTLDGVDPRAPGGGIAPAAKPYQTGLAPPKNGRVFSRVLSGTRWSAPAMFVPPP